MVSDYARWQRAFNEGIIPQDVMDQYDSGEPIRFKTDYGDGYLSKESHLKSQEFALDLSKPVQVCTG